MADHLKETELSSEVVYQGGFLQIRQDQVRMPDGTQSRREYVVHPGAAAMVPLFADGRVLIERQFRSRVTYTRPWRPSRARSSGSSARRTILAARSSTS